MSPYQRAQILRTFMLMQTLLAICISLAKKTWYTTSLARQMLDVEIYLSESYVRGREGPPRCTDIVQYEIKIKIVEDYLPRLRVIRMESPGQMSRLHANFKKIRETYSVRELWTKQRRHSILEYAVLVSEFYSRGVITVGWHFTRRLYEYYDSPRERVAKIIDLMISSEVEVQENKREIIGNVVKHRFKLPKEYLLYLVYDLIVFSKILDIYERDLGYKHGNRPGASIDFD